MVIHIMYCIHTTTHNTGENFHHAYGGDDDDDYDDDCDVDEGGEDVGDAKEDRSCYSIPAQW